MKDKVTLLVANATWDGKSKLSELLSAVPILTALLKDDFDFSVIDANGKNLSKEETVEAIRNTGAKVVLITALAVQWHATYHEAARLAKEALPCKVLMGGVYPTVSGEHVMLDGNVDYIMLGHAEERISRIVRKILDEDPSLKQEHGIGFRDENRVVINPVKTFIGDCKEMVKPDYSCVDLTPYLTASHQKNAIAKREASIITSYGCPYHCTFCAARTISGTRIVYRPVEDVLEEIVSNSELPNRFCTFSG